MNRIQGFVKTQGTSIVDGEGQELILTGVGLGNWMLQEGYMWKFYHARADRPRRIEVLVVDLIGEEHAEAFWNDFYNRFITEFDIQEMARLGFNSVRLPINARFIWHEGTINEYIERNLQRIDQLIDWCRKYELYVILDLHGAPGGQTGANIDDSMNDHPDLFTSVDNRRATIQMWGMLATRYKDDPVVAGYDLLNEPLAPAFGTQYHADLLQIYKDITDEIRKVDSNHMIIVEGAQWATDWSVFTEKFDDNLVFQFHKYWSAPDTTSILRYLDTRAELNAPIWMGEGGENSHEWLIGCFQLLEDHGIGWNFWTWKKLDTLTSPYSINPPDGWDVVLGYIEGGPKPDQQTALRIFREYLDHVDIKKCTARPEVVNALLRRPNPSLRIPAAYYGFRGEGVSYESVSRNEHPFRVLDGPRIENMAGHESVLPEFSFGSHLQPENQLCIALDAEDWVRYEVNSEETQPYRLKFHLCTEMTGAKLAIQCDESQVEDVIVELSTVGWQVFDAPQSIELSSGRRTVAVKALLGTVKIEWIEIARAN